MKIYIAGPMTGIPQFNFPAFYTAADALRELGYEVVSPAEIDDKEDAGAAMSSKTGKLGTGTGFGSKTWADFLMRDVKLIGDVVDGVCVLPNWQISRGARLEVFVAINVQKPVFTLEAGALIGLDNIDLVETLLEFTVDQGDTSHYTMEERQ